MSNENLQHPALRGRPFSQRLAQGLSDLRNGRPVLLMDDAERENEADLIAAAETINVAVMAQMIRNGSGIVCLCLPEEDLQHLNLPPMVANNESPYQTAFTVSIEATRGVTTGVSAADRVTTIKAAVAPGATATDLRRPGHVFPLRAVKGGIMQRRGHTEGSVELARLAGLRAAGVLCELTNDDGSMARDEQVASYAKEHNLVVLTIAELVEHLKAQARQAA